MPVVGFETSGNSVFQSQQSWPSSGHAEKTFFSEARDRTVLDLALTEFLMFYVNNY